MQIGQSRINDAVSARPTSRATGPSIVRFVGLLGLGGCLLLSRLYYSLIWVAGLMQKTPRWVSDEFEKWLKHCHETFDKELVLSEYVDERRFQTDTKKKEEEVFITLTMRTLFLILSRLFTLGP